MIISYTAATTCIFLYSACTNKLTFHSFIQTLLCWFWSLICFLLLFSFATYHLPGPAAILWKGLKDKPGENKKVENSTNTLNLSISPLLKRNGSKRTLLTQCLLPSRCLGVFHFHRDKFQKPQASHQSVTLLYWQEMKQDASFARGESSVVPSSEAGSEPVQ